MKRSIKLLGLLLVMILLSGCMKVKTEITVNGNGSVDYSYTAAISSKVQDMMKSEDSEESDDNSSIVTEDDKKEAKEKGYSIEDYNQDGYKGVIITKHFNSIDELSSEEDIESTTKLATEDNQKIFKVEKGFFKNKYIAKIDCKEEKDSNSQVSNYNSDEYKEYLAGLELTYSINLPSKAISNNATSVDGNKLTWDFTKFDGDKIEYEFEVLNMKNILLVVGGAILVVGIVVVVIIIIKKKKVSVK